MFGEGAVYSSEFFGKLMTTFKECLYEFIDHKDNMLGSNPIVNEVMRTQPVNEVSYTQSSYQRKRLSFAKYNTNLFAKFLARIATMIACNSMYLPLRLPPIFECCDINSIKVTDMNAKQLNYYGLSVDVAINIQVLYTKFFNTIKGDVYKVGSHPFQDLQNSLCVSPRTVFNKRIHKFTEFTVVDTFEDLEAGKNVLVTEFFVLWPLYHHTLTTPNQGKKKKPMSYYEEKLKGNSGETLRSLVKTFKLDEEGYPIMMTGDFYLK